MKKILAFLLLVSLLSGCTTNDTSNDTQNGNGTTDVPSDNNDMSSNQDSSSNNDWYTNFETALASKDFRYSSKEKLDASSVNGAEGYRYVTDQGNIDVYRYEQGNNFDQIARDKRLTIDGKERQVEVNGNYVIVSDDVDQGILDIFKNMR